MSVRINGVKPGSIAEEIGLEPGDFIVKINDNKIYDILDYDFYQKDEFLTLEIATKDTGEHVEVEIEKEEIEDLGAEFETYLIDKQHTCTNNCVFCFVDQMPEGMRESLYFKDDDSRLSFLFGNYITMTNMKQREIDRIVKMHISPIHISVHATNPDKRKELLGNRFAGSSLSYLKQLAKAGIDLHCQIVLCRELNDGEILDETLRDLYALGDSLQSVAVVPVGLTKFREKLYPLLPHNKETALKALGQVGKMGQLALKERGRRIFYPSDELFLLAQVPLPAGGYYEEYPQIENGVGLLTSLREEFCEALNQLEIEEQTPRKIDMATGEAAFETISIMAERLEETHPWYRVKVHKIKNQFFGGNVTVAGLMTSKDLITQLKGKLQSDNLLLPSVILNYGENKLLDDMSIEQLAQALKTNITFVNNNGEELLFAMVGKERK